MSRLTRVAGVLCALSAVVPAVAHALPRGGEATEHRVPSGDGTLLDLDVIRKEGTPATVRQPVILVVSPYTLPENGGPSTRFDDFIDATDALERGYTYAIATLRSFGQSAGCSDWGGPGERMDVAAAVEWAASQPFSSGRVGLLGKSYDGWTGLMGIAEQPHGLEAVLSMEPVFDGYGYLYDDGIRFGQSAYTPITFMTEAQPLCAAETVVAAQDDDPASAYWQQREVTEAARSSRTPLFLTQGFLERNTKPEGALRYWQATHAPKRAWFGQFDHVRGYDRQGDEPAVGRDGFLDEAMDFYDAFLLQDEAARERFDAAPQVAVQDSEGRYRGEASWPPADAVARATTLRTGVFADDGANFGAREGAYFTAPSEVPTGLGIWSISQPMPGTRRLAGEPVIDLDLVTAVPRANVVANVYDLAPDGSAVLVSRGADLVRLPGKQRHRLRMYSQDWVFAEGHRIAVLLSGSNSEWWIHTPTGSPVTVLEAFAELPLVREPRSVFLGGAVTPRLREHRETATITVPAPVVAAAQTPFDVG